jgi:Flp pilus assembly CpaE family ATPase
VPVTIVDVAFCLEGGDASDGLLDGSALRRNAATLATLAEADVILAVGSADPVGLQRLLRMLPEVRGLTEGDLRVVLNRVRRTSTGAHSHQPLTDVVVRHSGLVPVAYLPEDRSSCDLALSSGRSLTEVAPKSPLRRAIARLARELAVHPESALAPLG